VRCEARLIEEARRLNHVGKMLAPIIDDAHLMDISALRRVRLLFEDFPKNHNLILIAQPELLTRLSLTTNEDIKSRVTYSVLLQKLAPDDMQRFILAELDRVTLAHSTFTDDALSLNAPPELLACERNGAGSAPAAELDFGDAASGANLPQQP
jgi:type II secretory pathway predicted ATPase ExeA